MFSYIYADGKDNRQLSYYIVAKTEAGINRLALDFISSMVNESRTNKIAPSLQAVIDAVETKNVPQAIDNWNIFITTDGRQTVSRHAIEPVKLVE